MVEFFFRRRDHPTRGSPSQHLLNAFGRLSLGTAPHASCTMSWHRHRIAASVSRFLRPYRLQAI